MSEPRRFSFGSVPVYNPQSLTKQEALAQFHARQGVYESLIELLGEERPSHVLIIGTRGMGKTTLLQRVRYGVEDSPQLSLRYLALSFPEEQYNVTHLHHFLLNTLDSLADSLEQTGDQRTLAEVEAYAAHAGKLTQEEVELGVPQFLAAISKALQRNFLLLVDNADRLFEMIEGKEQWRLRELLSNRQDLTFFGATTQASEGIYTSDRAFYEFFKIYRLGSLTLDEVKTLLIRLSESVGEKAGEAGAAKRRVEEWLAADASRLRTLVQLTGGNPRTTVLLFHLVLDGLGGGAREYLEQLLDQCTPNYKGRIDELPPQAQQVLDALALKWDPATALEVAGISGLETNVVSTQLTRLVRQGIVEKADPGDSKKAMYQVAERFFNIWYLMRASRRVRAKLRWFVEFLRVFFEASELDQFAWDQLDRYRRGPRAGGLEIENIFAYAIASGRDRNRYEEYLRHECADREKEWGPFIESLGSIAIDVSTEERQRSRSQIDSIRSSEPVALVRAVQYDPNDTVSWRTLSQFVHAEHQLSVEVESLFRFAISEQSTSVIAWVNLGRFLCLFELERAEEAESALRKAIELDPQLAWPWGCLGDLLRRMPKREEEAEAALRKVIELDSKYAWAWGSLGALLRMVPNREEEAETALRKAIELDSKNVWAWGNLGELLRRIPNREEESESALRKAIELDSKDAWVWRRLGHLLGSMPNREEEAEAALRKAIELDPKYAQAWQILGRLLTESGKRLGEAETAYRKALDIDPKNADYWRDFAVFLACDARQVSRAKVAFRKSLELEPDSTKTMRNFGVLLVCETDRKEEGIQFIRRAIQPDPFDRVTPNVATAVFIGAVDLSSDATEFLPSISSASSDPDFWAELLHLCQSYPPFGKILARLCDLILEREPSHGYARLHRAVGLAQLQDFPRASVALDDALNGDPIELLSWGRNALETIFAAAVKGGRIRECLEVIERKEWIDAWRPIYEALKAVDAGSGDYLKRIAVEIRHPAQIILRRIAPELRGLPEAIE